MTNKYLEKIAKLSEAEKEVVKGTIIGGGAAAASTLLVPKKYSKALLLGSLVGLGTLASLPTVARLRNKNKTK